MFWMRVISCLFKFAVLLMVLTRCSFHVYHSMFASQRVIYVIYSVMISHILCSLLVSFVISNHKAITLPLTPTLSFSFILPLLLSFSFSNKFFLFHSASIWQIFIRILAKVIRKYSCQKDESNQMLFSIHRHIDILSI